jgi:MoxR-like ATPase
VAYSDIRDLAPDVLRHRIVLSYDALTENVSADDVLSRVFTVVDEPPADHLTRPEAAA